MPTTLYDVLEVGQSASQEAVVDAYKRLHARLAARINGIEGSDQDTLCRMARLREAFHTLSDPERRRDYDARLAARQNDTPAIIAGTPRSFVKSLLIAGMAGALSIGYTTLRSGKETNRQERERIAAEAKMSDVLLQREREAKKAAAMVDFEHRRDEAIERSIREGAAGGPPPPVPGRESAGHTG